jgi:hypothetical protein
MWQHRLTLIRLAAIGSSTAVRAAELTAKIRKTNGTDG